MPNAPRRAQRLAARPRVEEVAGEEFIDAEAGDQGELDADRLPGRVDESGGHRIRTMSPPRVHPASPAGRKPDGNPALVGLVGAQLQAARLEQVKRVSAARDFYIESLRELGTSRDLAIARQRVEEANMWAVKHITR